MNKPLPVLAATGLLGGFHVTVGLLTLVVTTGALAAIVPPLTAHVLASLTFGVGLVMLTVGRSELFTENFLIPVAAAAFGHATKRAVLRLWAVTLAANLAGIARFSSGSWPARLTRASSTSYETPRWRSPATWRAGCS